MEILKPLLSKEVSGQIVQNNLDVVKIDRYKLSETWWKLLQKLAGRQPSTVEGWAMNYAYNKIVERMQAMTDAELMQDVSDILDSLNMVTLAIPGLEIKGVYKK